MRMLSSLYPWLRSPLFRLDPERAHHVAMSALDLTYRAHLLPLLQPGIGSAQPIEVVGLRFPNRLGLAAGFDKDGEYTDALGALGFGFVEVGTVTPRAQPGNPKPRLFRLPNDQALINRMGFNNRGVDHLIARLSMRRRPGIIGVNIGKNKDTPLEDAHRDYCLCLEKVAPYADYVAVNISSPNTPGLRTLQEPDQLRRLLDTLLSTRAALLPHLGRPLPLLVKIAPDLEEEPMRELAALLGASGIDGVIATNTTVSRPQLVDAQRAQEQGGLSGRPLTEKSRAAVRLIRATLPAAMPIIGVGGVFSGNDAVQLLDAGASLVQIYTGFIYRGPGIVPEVLQATAGWRQPAGSASQQALSAVQTGSVQQHAGGVR